MAAPSHFKLRPFVMLLLSCACLSFPLHAQTDDGKIPTYHHTTAEVRLTFLVTDQSASPPELQQNDFVVVDSDAVVRDFRSFSRARQTKLDLWLLLDCSESVLPQLTRELHAVIRLLSDTPLLDEARVSLMSFAGTQPKILCAGNCRAWLASGAPLQVSAAGSTPLFDAVVLASSILGQKDDPALRRVLVIFSDGLDTISLHSAPEAIASTLRAEAQIYTLDLASPKNHTREGIDTLKRLAGVTGGTYFAGSDGAPEILQSVLADLRSSYVVTYTVPNRRPGYHEIRIMPTHNLNLEFRSRRGYYYGDRP